MSWTSLARRHRRWVIAGWLTAVVVGGFFASDLPQRIVPGGDLPASAEAARVQRDAVAPSLYVAITPAGRRLTPGELAAVVGRIAAVPGVTQAMLRPAGRRAREAGGVRVVLVSTEPGFEASIAVAERLDRDRGRLAPSGGSVAVGGFAAYREQLSRLSRSDLSRAERIGLPIILIVLFLTFGSLWAAALPLAIALSSVVIGLGLADLVARTTDVADFVTNTATMLGVALGVDYALFVLQRVREESRGGATLDVAISRSMATTGRAVAWSAAIVVLAESTMFLVDSRAVRSIAIGLVLVTLVALAMSLIVLPVLLDMLGPRVLRSVWDRWRPGRERGCRGWTRWAAFVAGRPRMLAVAGTAVLVLLSLPAVNLGSHVHAPETTQLPAALHVRDAATAAASAYGPGAASPVQLLTAPAPAAGAVRKAIAALRRDPRVAGVSTAEQPGARVLLTVASAHEPQHPETQALVEDLRHGELAAELAPLDALVGGETAAAIDIRATSFSGLLTVLAVLLPLVLLLFTVVLRSLLLPLKAVLLVCLSLTAAFGSLLLLTDTSTGAGLVGQAIPIGIHPIVPIVVAAIAIALTTDYEVILIGRIREQFELHRDNTRAIREGLAQTGPVITAAGVIMLVVFGTFASADVFPIKQMGIGLGMVVLLDATVVRGVLVPATMVLFGRGNWWLPGGHGRRPGDAILITAAAMSWIGVIAYNIGHGDLLGLETLVPTLVYALIGVLWRTRRQSLATKLLGRWALAHLVVGIVALLVAGHLDATAARYGFHAAYGLLQVPIILALRRRSALSTKSLTQPLSPVLGPTEPAPSGPQVPQTS